MLKTNRTFFVLALLPVAAWIAVILYYTVNLPWFDDFDPFPDFLNKWIHAPSLSEKLTFLFQPNNEHRMVVGKLVTLLYYWVTGTLNFTFLHIAGACFSLGTLAIFWHFFQKTSLNRWYFLPVPILLFTFQAHLVFLWAICSLQHQPVIFFMCLSMFFLAKEKPGLGILAAIGGTFVMSNGIFVWPAGVVVLLFQSKYKSLIFWVIAALVAVFLYLNGMSAQGNESSVEFFLVNPHLSVLGFFASLGGLFDFFPEKPIFTRSVLPVLTGFAVMIWVAIWLLRLFFAWLQTVVSWRPKLPVWLSYRAQLSSDQRQMQFFLLGIMSFLLVNALVICLLRPRFGFFVMIVSNYKMYPALFLAVAYLSFINSGLTPKLQLRGFGLALMGGVAVWVLSAIYYLPVIAERSRNLTVNGFNQEFNGYGLGHVPFSKSARYVDSLMKEMVAAGVYQFPEAGKALAEQAKAVSEITRPESASLEKQPNGIYVYDALNTISLSRQTGSYAFVRNASRIYLFRLEPKKYEGRNVFRQFDKGSDLNIPYAVLLPGTYNVGILRLKGGAHSGGILEKITIP